MVTGLKELSTSGAVKATPGHVYSVTLTAAAAAATLQIRNGGSGGTIVKTIKAPIGETCSCELHGALFAQGIYGTLSGTGALASFEYR